MSPTFVGTSTGAKTKIQIIFWLTLSPTSRQDDNKLDGYGVQSYSATFTLGYNDNDYQIIASTASHNLN